MHTALLCCCASLLQELVSRGVTDPARVSVGGHSYGAFMAANLVAHCPQLFAAAIARSGTSLQPLTATAPTAWLAEGVYAQPMHQCMQSGVELRWYCTSCRLLVRLPANRLFLCAESSLTVGRNAMRLEPTCPLLCVQARTTAR